MAWRIRAADSYACSLASPSRTSSNHLLPSRYFHNVPRRRSVCGEMPGASVNVRMRAIGTAVGKSVDAPPFVEHRRGSGRSSPTVATDGVRETRSCGLKNAVCLLAAAIILAAVVYATSVIGLSSRGMTTVDIVWGAELPELDAASFERAENARLSTTVSSSLLEKHCARGVPHFATFAFTHVGRWSADEMVRGLQLMYSSLVRAHACVPKLYVYTDSSVVIDRLTSLKTTMRGATSILPKYIDSNIVADHGFPDPWMKLSRFKLDVLKGHLQQGRQVVWIDIDTLVFHDLSALMRAAPSWLIGWHHGKAGGGPSPPGVNVSGHTIPPKFQAQGDLWTIDLEGIGEVESLERKLRSQDTELPLYDLQGYFTVLLTTNSTRMRLAQDIAPEFAFGFACSSYQHPSNKTFRPLITEDDELFCEGKPVGSISFTAPTFTTMLLESDSFSAILDDATRGWFRRFFYDDGERKVSVSQTELAYAIPSSLHAWTQSLVVGVLSSNKDRRDTIRQTWGYGRQVLFLVAGPTAALRAEQAAHDDMVLLDIQESYATLAYKSQTLFHVVDKYVKGFDYVLKTDDDSFVDVDELLHVLGEVKPDYWGRVWPHAKPHREPDSQWFVSKEIFAPSVYPPFCSGAGYVVSKAFIACAVPKMSELPNLILEDVATGILAQQCSMRPVNSNLIQHLVPADTPFVIRHYVKTREAMRALWQGRSSRW